MAIEIMTFNTTQQNNTYWSSWHLHLLVAFSIEWSPQGIDYTWNYNLCCFLYNFFSLHRRSLKWFHHRMEWISWKRSPCLHWQIKSAECDAFQNHQIMTLPRSNNAWWSVSGKVCGLIEKCNVEQIHVKWPHLHVSILHVGLRTPTYWYVHCMYLQSAS